MEYYKSSIDSKKEIESKALADLMKTNPAICDNFNEELKHQVKLSITKTVEDVSELERKFEQDPFVTVEDALSHLAPHHRQLIKSSFDIQTYQAVINSENNTVSFCKDENIVLPSIPLDSVENYRRAILLVQVSIIVETVIFLLNLLGVAVSKGRIKKAIENLAAKLSKSELFRNLLMSMAEAVKSKDFIGLARLMIALLIALYKKGLLWEIVRDLLSSMSWIDYAGIAGKILAFLIACELTGGAALIATCKLVAKLVTATAYIKKFYNLSALSCEVESKL